MTSAYESLVGTFTKLYRFNHLAAIASWDQAAMMPSKGSESRGLALAELSLHMHQLLTADGLPAQLARAAAEPLSSLQQASLREMRWQWQLANALPAELVEAKSIAGSRCEHAWRTQRKRNDWAGFCENFREVVTLARREAEILAAKNGGGRYDALLAKFEPGLTSTAIDSYFAPLRSRLPSLLAEVCQRQSNQRVINPVGPFPIETQKALALDVMAVLGFDFDAGRLDVSVHPFCGGVAQDVRITTRYSEDSFVGALMGVVHETGHARYEQGLPADFVHLPVGQARSMAVHESQSLAFEMQLGRSRAFLQLIAPLLEKHFGAQPAFSVDNLYRLYTTVSPGKIRVDADEVTYPAHIMLRFEIEKSLIEGEIEIEDIPALWNQKMQQYLGVNTVGDFADGCMQDIHWTDGSFGYFPSYTLGAMLAAQLFAAMRTQMPLFDSDLAQGKLTGIFDWLANNIWSQASVHSTQELVLRATGSELSATSFIAHLERRYLG